MSAAKWDFHSICTYCNQKKNKLEGDNGCSLKAVSLEGEMRPRIPYIKPYLPEEYNYCHDCGVTEFRYHHPGCDMERCPNCDQQFITCECLPDDENLVKDVKFYIAAWEEDIRHKTNCSVCGHLGVEKFYHLENDKNEIVQTFFTCKAHTNSKIERDLRKGVSVEKIVKKWNK